MVKVKRRVQTVVNYWRRMLFSETDHWLMRELMHGKPLRTDARFIRKRMMQVKAKLILHLLKQPWYVFLALLLVHFVRGDILTVDELPLLSSEVDGGSSASPKRLRVVFSGFQMQEGQTWSNMGIKAFRWRKLLQRADWIGKSKNGKSFAWEKWSKSFAKICKDLLLVRSSTASIWSSLISQFRARLRPCIG